MSIWSPTRPQPSQLVRDLTELHVDHYGKRPDAIASAPATWALIGDGTDHAQGLTLMGLGHLRSAVAASPRSDFKISVHLHSPDIAKADYSHSHTESTKGDEANKHTGDITHRLINVVQSLMQRQMLSRDTQGFDITIYSEIPSGVGLGAMAAIECAFAYAVAMEPEDISHAPTKAKLAEVLLQAATSTSTCPPLRARYTAMTRGLGEMTNIIDYADFSVTQAAPAIGSDTGTQSFIIAPSQFEYDATEMTQREAFVDYATRAFATDSLRSLPDFDTRILSWLKAVHKVGAHQVIPELTYVPSVEKARVWLDFYSAELVLAQKVTSLLRSRRLSDVYSLLNASHDLMVTNLALSHNEYELAQLVLDRGALSARATRAGISNAIVSIVSEKRANNIAADLSADGLIVIPMHPGEPALKH
ncbi:MULTISPECIES: galactokinase family protein [unclassified Corynebacterium]|uniref:galactokinase family protein n=1 Tax=unclassified Corynebacterium TaxID=2624378 RepID=UPI002169D8ED|nr:MULTISPECIES: galactokinase family protein [unclassified Corynebacterium]MCS4490616.1 galactokinase [Corynebacterium sp. ES2775-CONJ]MCS4532413.1 galactokinase [Corynebacterium sp. ES2730-CONJ]